MLFIIDSSKYNFNSFLKFKIINITWYKSFYKINWRYIKLQFDIMSSLLSKKEYLEFIKIGSIYIKIEIFDNTVLCGKKERLIQCNYKYEY